MSVGQRRMRVGISGSYGGFNLGDEAILTAILQELRESLPVEVTVFSRDPDDTLRRHGVEHALHLRSLSLRDTRTVISGLDLLILGGGGILYDRDADMFLRGVNLAHEVGTPVMVYAISAGPLVEIPVRVRVREALQQAAAITVRDRHTQRLLEELGITQQVLLTADPAVLLRAEPLTWEEILRSEAINPGARLIGISVREPGPAAPDLRVEHYHRLVANAADFMIDRFDAEVVFFPMERRAFDVQHSHGVVGQMSHAQRATVLKRDYTPGQLVSLLERFEFTVGMRLHFLIFSALAGVPFTALPYATKVSGFLEELQLRTPELSEVSAGQLIAIIDRAWDQRELLRASLSTGLVDLQRRAHRNNQIAVQLLTLSTAPQLQEQPGA
ncbi:MAG: polysaccharide pyruvyl transferase family protein [Myxococcota bacterium]|nr:polysaccharide pyruvyl transferase family protein [Myxococcota bacterium]